MRFTKDHEWIRVEDGVAIVGVTAYAADQLGDVVFVELPEAGKTVAPGDGLAVVESVKAASDVYAPVTGEVVGANDELASHPETVNQDPEGAGWFVKLKLSDPAQLDALMDRAAYETYLGTL
ncbi:MAG: glycine cleavage system protein GcvH [Caulobacteraceae bacterium]|nr:glycine cleavage system protein GcvH [Caulobacteraceae bacterium]